MKLWFSELPSAADPRLHKNTMKEAAIQPPENEASQGCAPHSSRTLTPTAQRCQPDHTIFTIPRLSMNEIYKRQNLNLGIPIPEWLLNIVF